MSLWLHEIAESDHRILNPLNERKLLLLGRLSRVGPDATVLDLACGKGELLCRWAEEFGTRGHGVDLSEVFLAAARARATELGVAQRVGFEQGDAAEHTPQGRYDVVSCLGATWIGDGVPGTIDLMRRAVTPDGLLLVGEPYWIDPPPDEARRAYAPYEFTDLAGLLDLFHHAGVELVEMVLADSDDWDRYSAAQWWNLAEWLRSHTRHGRAAEVRAFRDETQRSYLRYGRRYLGWGVFLLRPGGTLNQPID